MSKIVGKLREIQLARGLTDMQMAQRLNCSRQNYQKTRTGEIPLGIKILKGISVAFPELQGDVIYFLSNGANKLPDNATKNPSFQGLKSFCARLLARIRKAL